eukprot:5250597-Pleurochrysis_carterae.AAC.1
MNSKRRSKGYRAELKASEGGCARGTNGKSEKWERREKRRREERETRKSAQRTVGERSGREGEWASRGVERRGQGRGETARASGLAAPGLRWTSAASAVTEARARQSHRPNVESDEQPGRTSHTREGRK